MILKKFLSTNTHAKILFLTTCLALIYYSWNINSWKFSYVGDEWASYTFAKNIAINNFIINPFSFNGVYGENGVLGSIYQAIFLKILGFSNFAWRFSNIFLIIPITIFFYLWIKQSINKQIALISTVILQSSFYLANFFKIGYINPQALTLFIINLYLANKCIQAKEKKWFFLLGIMLGVAFYIYIGPIIPFLIWPYLLQLLSKGGFKQAFRNSFFIILGYILLLLPALIQLSTWNGPAKKTFLHREFTDNNQIFVNIYHNFLLFYKNYDYFYNHFVAGPYLDLVTGILAFIGIVLILFNLRKLPFLQILLSYISTCIIIGVTSPYTYAPTTRGIFFLPFGAAFAGIALYYIMKKVPKYFIILTLSIVFVLNFYQSQIGVFNISGYSNTSLIIKAIQDAQGNNAMKNTILLLSNSNPYNYYDLKNMRQAYDLEEAPFS